jgi:hypothetical protein
VPVPFLQVCLLPLVSAVWATFFRALAQAAVRVTWDSGDVEHFVREALQLQDGQG